MAVTIEGVDAGRAVDAGRERNALVERQRKAIQLDPRLGVEDTLSAADAIALHKWNLSSSNPKQIPQQLADRFKPQIEWDQAAEIGVNFGTDVEQAIRDAKVRRSTGTYGQFKDPEQQRHDDAFLLQFEEAWHNTRGRVDPLFYIQNSEDIHLLGMDADAAEKLAGIERLWTAMDKTQATMDRAQEARVDLVLANYNVSREEAAKMLTKWDLAMQQGDQAVAQYTDEELLDLAGYATASEMGIGFAKQSLQDDQYEKYLAKGKRMVWMEATEAFAGDVLPPQASTGLNFASIMMGKDYTASGIAKAGISTAFGVVGKGINAVANVSGWLLEAGGLDIDGAAFNRGMDLLFGGSQTVQARQAQQDWLNAEAGRTHEDIVADYAALGLMAGWESMRKENPEEFNLYVAMAGGNESVARAMWSQDAQYMGITMEDGTETNIKEMAEKQAELYEDNIKYNLEQLEDENFGTSDALLSLLAIWGEGVENLATVATLGGKQLWDDANDLLWTGGVNRGKRSWSLQDLYEDVQRVDTPAGALGLEGTLTGLAFNLGSMALLDPMTWIFGPRLARTGRAGPISAAQATAVVESRVAAMSRNQLIDIALSSNRSATAFNTLLNVYGETGLASRYLGLIHGFKNPLTTFWKGLEKWGKAADDVYVPTLRGSMPRGATYSDDVIEAAHKQLLDGSYDPVVIEYNPTNGARQVVVGGEYVAAAEKYGISNLQTTMKPNSGFGVTETFRVGDRLMPDYDLELIKKVADEGVEINKKVPGADETVRKDIIAQGELLKGAAVKRGVIELPEGTFEVKAINDRYIVLDPQGKVVGGISGSGSIGFAVDAPSSLAGRTLELAFNSGDDLLTGLIKSESISGDGAAFIQNQARRVVDKIERELADGVDTGEWVNHTGDARMVDIDGTPFVSPRNIMPDDLRWGEAIDMDALKQLEFEHIMRGGDPMNANRSAMSVAIGQAFRETLAATGVGRRLEQFMTPVNNNLLLRHTGPTGISNTSNVISRIFSSVDDMEGLELANRRIMNYWSERGQLTRQADDLTARQAALQAQLEGFESAIGNNRWRDAGELIADPDAAARAKLTALEAHKEIRAKITALDKEMSALREQQKAVAMQLNNFDGLNSVLDDIFDEFIQKHVASNPAFKELLDADGRIDPKKVSTRSQTPQGQMEAALARARADKSNLGQATMKELGYIPDFMKPIIETMDHATLEQITRFINETQHGGKNSAGYAMAMSPLELMAAANGTPQVMRELARSVTNQQIRQFAHMAHNFWMIDKVMTPRTAIVVSLDELMRAWHTGGVYSTLQYFEDKIMNATRIVNKQMQLPGFAKLEARWQRRIQALQEYPDFFKEMQGAILDNKGYGLDTIPFRKGHANHDYFAAAQETAQLRLTEPGWQSYFKGQDAFREWFQTSTEAELLRTANYWDAANNVRRAGLTWEQVYQGYETLYALSVRNLKEGRRGAARKAWAEAAERAINADKPVTLPNWVLEGFGEVQGAAKVPSAVLPRGVEYVSDALFQRPMNYRQGFLAEMVRKSEMARLQKLFDSQGVHIVSDAEIMSLLRNKYPALHERFLLEGIDGIARELMDTEKIVSARSVRSMIESKVVSEMENQLYAFHMQSAAGRKARAVVPFGKPWADMWGFWGREMLGRPQLRGLLNSENYGKITQGVNALVDASPVNPKTVGLISRLAATDFDLDKIEDDPLFGGTARALGVDRMDVGNALFLPVGGESPWLVLLPGLGAFPGVMMEAALDHLAPDPLEDPTGYQMFMDQWSKVLPGVGYNRQSSIGGLLKETVLGGGVVSRTSQLMENFGMMFDDNVSITPNDITGDWKMGMAYGRQVKVAFAQEGIWEELANLPEDMASVGLEAFINDSLKAIQQDAAKEVGWQMFKEGAIELMAPARITTLSQREDLEEVWLDALDYLDVSDTFKSRLNLDTETGRREAAGRIADWFFGLTPDQKDNYVAAHPELAVNTISLWTWSDYALTHQIEGSGLPYRSGGSTEDRNRHETMIELGYVRVLTPRELAVRIIGTVASAKAGVARRVYEDAARAVNDDRWEKLSDQDKNYLEYLRKQLADAGEVPYEDARQVWENFSKVRDVIWFLNGQPMKKDGKELVPDKVTLPQKLAPWGETLPSEFKDLREEYENGYPLPFVSDELKAAAAAAGIDVEAGMEMSGIYQAVANNRAANLTDNPAFSIVGPEYQAWLAPRSAAHQDVIAKLNTILDAEGVSEETRYQYRKTFIFLEDAIDRKHAGDASWMEVRDRAATLFKGLREDDIFRQTPLEFYWDQAYGSQLGALDWTPDEPAPLFKVDGTFSDQAQRIFPRKVYDGDTIQFSSSATERLFGHLGGPSISPKVYSVRMLGVNAREMGEPGGEEDRQRLVEKIDYAIDNDIPIYMVKDPDRYGYTDFYGRVFGWIYIGDEAFSFPETQYPRR